jgi:hypothetical protein
LINLSKCEDEYSREFFCGRDAYFIKQKLIGMATGFKREIGILALLNKQIIREI